MLVTKYGKEISGHRVNLGSMEEIEVNVRV